MNYTIYILYSESADSYYKGQTSDMGDRLTRHNASSERATKNGVPWKLVWSTVKETRGEALKLERKLKNLSRERTIQFMNKHSK